MSCFKDYYEILGVAPNASPKDIKKKYWALAARTQSLAMDGDKEATEQLMAYNEAYEVLSRPDRRGRFDASCLAHDLGARAPRTPQQDVRAAIWSRQLSLAMGHVEAINAGEKVLQRADLLDRNFQASITLAPYVLEKIDSKRLGQAGITALRERLYAASPDLYVNKMMPYYIGRLNAGGQIVHTMAQLARFLDKDEGLAQAMKEGVRWDGWRQSLLAPLRKKIDAILTPPAAVEEPILPASSVFRRVRHWLSRIGCDAGVA